MGGAFSKWARWEDPGIQAMSFAPSGGRTAGPAIFQGARNLTINGGNFPLSVTNIQADEGLAKILDFLSTVNFRAIHQENIDKWTPGTVKWFLESDIFRHWLLSQWAILWGTGMPGAGKTILASMAIEHLNSMAEESSDICVAFVYCRYTEPMTVKAVLAAVVRQLLERHPHLIPLVEPICKKHQLQKTRLTHRELIGIIRDIFATFRVAYFFIDGLDEALPDDQFDLVDALKTIKANFMITSRPLHILENVLSDAVFFDIIAREEDVRLLVSQRIERSPELQQLLRKSGRTEEVLTQVCKASEGMFLHAALLIENVRHCTSLKKIMARLEEMPKGLDELYTETFRRIEAQSEDRASIAKRALCWLLFAQYPLPMEAVRLAVSEDLAEACKDSALVVEESTLLAACCGLIIVENHPATGIPYPRLIHYTACDTLRVLLSGCEPPPHSILTEACLQRLNESGIYQCTRTPDARVSQIFREAMFRDPLLEYAHSSVGKHALNSGSGPFVIQFFRSCQMFPVKVPPFGPLDHLKCFLHLVAHYDMLPWLHLDLTDVNERTELGRTALMIAVHNRNAAMVRELLSVDKIDANIEDSLGNTALSCAVRRGDLEVLEVLLRHPKVNINHVNRRGDTAILGVFNNSGYSIDKFATFERLLHAPQLNLNLRDAQGLTAFMFVASAQWPPQTRAYFLQLVAKHPATEQNARNRFGANAFLWGCSHGLTPTEVSWFLQLPGADVSVKDYRGRNALMYLARYTRLFEWQHIHAALTDLLSRGIGVNEVDNEGKTALFYAARSQNSATIKAFAQLPGVDFTCRDHNGQTPLMGATNTGVVDFLLDRPDCQLDARNNTGRTAFLTACSRTDRSAWPWLPDPDEWSIYIVPKFLSRPDVDCNITDAGGRGAVELALLAGVIETVRKTISPCRSPTPLVDSMHQETLPDGRRFLSLQITSHWHGRYVRRLVEVPNIQVHLECNPEAQVPTSQTISIRVVATMLDSPPTAGLPHDVDIRRQFSLFAEIDRVDTIERPHEPLGWPSCLDFPWECGWLSEDCDGLVQFLLQHPGMDSRGFDYLRRSTDESREDDLNYLYLPHDAM